MKNEKEFLAHKAYDLRVSSLEATSEAGSGHPTTCLSAADIVSVLFFHAMKFDPTYPKNSYNDRFVLSKGHAAPLLYAAWKEVGVLNHDELLTLRKFGSILEGHPTPRAPFVDVATGSLGMGLSMGAGMALSAKRDSLDYYTYILLGDSELAEGAVWEAIEVAHFYKLDNLIAVVDINRLGQRGETMDGYNLDAIEKKFHAFGWQTYVVDGHNILELIKAFDSARAAKNNLPQVILAKTIKGYGVAAVEGKNGFHGKAFTKEQLPALKEELKERFFFASWDNSPFVFESIKKSPVKVFKNIELSAPHYSKGEMRSPRSAFGEALVSLGKRSKDVTCFDAEVSNSTFTLDFSQQLPQQFVECFIAEQNMVGMAIGFAARGHIPYVATFAAFLTRAYDQLRMAAISRVALRVIGTHVGTEIGADGPSQMGLEDIALMRSISNSIVLYPSDAVSCYKLTSLLYQYRKGTSYLRVTRGSLPVIYENNEKFVIGDFHILRQSADDQFVIIGAGVTVHHALKAYEFLKNEGVLVSVVDLYSIKPLNEKKLQELVLRSGNKVVTVEDHYMVGGLGDAVLFALRNKCVQVVSLGVKDIPCSGSAVELFAWNGIDPASIVSAVKQEFSL